MSATPPTNRRFAFRLLVPLLAILITLVGLEIGLRVYHAFTKAKQTAVVQPKPLHIVTDAPYLYGLNPSENGTSAQGTRDDVVAIPKPKGTFRVLVLGDSLAYGSGIPQDKTFPNRLEALLRPEWPNAEVVNAGVSGYTPYNELQYYLTKGREFQPDLVVVAFCMNDVVNPRLHWGDAPNVKIPNEAIPNREYDQNHILPLMRQREEKRKAAQSSVPSLLEHSELYRALAPRVARLYAPKVIADPRRPTYITGEDTISIEVLMDRSSSESRWLRSMYDQLHAATKADGVSLVIVLFPLAYQIEADYPFIPQRLISDYCNQAGIPCLDLLPPFRQHPQEETFLLNQSSFYDIWHLTERGHDLSAHEIERFLRDKQLLPLSIPAK
jgi:lysophospholipase L1-like esterase